MDMEQNLRIYIQKIIIETVDQKHLKYYQKFTNNMRDKEKPKIKNKNIYTKITFLPDYKRFGIEGITDDIYNVLKKIMIYQYALLIMYQYILMIS